MKVVDQLNRVVYFQLDQTVKRIKAHSQRQFDALGIDITVEQWVLLKIVEEEAPISQVELARISMKDTAAITRMADALEQRGLIRRLDHPQDRRRYALELSTEGRYFLTQHMPLVEELRARGVAGITPQELKQLQMILEKITRNME